MIWPQLIGYARAKQYLLTGDAITGEEAARIGLVNFAHPAEELDAAVDAFAQRLAGGARRAVQWTKATINVGLKQLAASMLDAGMAYEVLSNRTRDHAEAVAAFRAQARAGFQRRLIPNAGELHGHGSGQGRRRHRRGRRHRTRLRQGLRGARRQGGGQRPGARQAKTGKPLAESVVDEIRAAGGQAVAAVESVAEWDSAHKIVQAALDSFGRIDCIVNNAGIVRDRFVFNMSREEWQAVVDVHLNGSFYMTRAAAPHFKSQESGSYIHMTSTSGLIGNLGQAQLLGGEDGRRRPVEIDRARHGAVQGAQQLHRAVGLDRDDGPHPGRDAGAEGPRREDEEDGERARSRRSPSTSRATRAAHVSGQIFGVRANEIYFFSQIRMIRSLQRSEGWTPETIAEQAMPAFEASFFENVPSMKLTPWDPV